MLWHGSTRPLVPTSAAPVPDAEALRRAALQASWQRDRRVARRRLWFRWTLWGLQTYAWQIAAGIAVLVALAVWLWPAGGPAATPAAHEPGALPESAGTTSSVAHAPPAPGNSASATALPLKLERSWQTVPPSGPPAAGLSPAPAEAPGPILKPDNWLHSKEP